MRDAFGCAGLLGVCLFLATPVVGQDRLCPELLWELKRLSARAPDAGARQGHAHRTAVGLRGPGDVAVGELGARIAGHQQGGVPVLAETG
jgi:hypothetical protein